MADSLDLPGAERYAANPGPGPTGEASNRQACKQTVITHHHE